MTEHFIELQSSSMICNDTSWAWSIFGHCIHNDIEGFSFALGFVSFLIWLFPTMPQIYENFKRGHCDDALSIYFLLMIYFGDWLNLTGAILSNQLPVQIYVAAYFIFQDSMLVGQYFYYKCKKSILDSKSYGRSGDNRMARGNFEKVPTTTSMLIVMSCIILSTMVNPVAGEANDVTLFLPFLKTNQERIGYTFGAISSALYFGSRIPQVYKNFQRRSTEGVSVLMFSLIIAANITYGLSVILGGLQLWKFLKHLPWLFGSLGCCLLDFVIVGQHFAYRKKYTTSIPKAESAASNVQLLVRKRRI